MPPNDERLAVTTDVNPATLQAVIRQGLVVGVLLVIGVVATALPGAALELPGTDVSVGALLSTTVSAAVFVAILLGAPALGTAVRACIRGPPDVVDDLASAARYGLVLAAVLVAYAGFAPTVVPLLAPEAAWTYDVAFLGFALVPTLAIGRRLFRSADPVARQLATAVANRSGRDRSDIERTPDG